MLKWAFEPSSFIDADRFLESLDGISKDEIINMIGRAIKQHPSLITEFSREEKEKPGINMDAISEKITRITSGELDYYHIDDATDRLYEIKNLADRLKEEKSIKDAADIYFVLVEGCVDAFDEGAALCRMRINKDILQSRVHYDKAVYLLSAVREIYAGNEARWLEFIRKFAADNKGKKKLMGMVRKEFRVNL